MLGAHFPQIKAVIANVPSGVRWGNAWTLDGQSLAFLNTSGQPVAEQLADGSTGYRWTPEFENALALCQLDSASHGPCQGSRARCDRADLGRLPEEGREELQAISSCHALFLAERKRARKQSQCCDS